MLAIIILGVLVGLDNLQIASAIGLLGLKPSRRFFLITSFVVFEVSMPLLGMMIGSTLNDKFEFVAEWLGPLIMILLGIYILVNELLEKEKKDFINNKWLLILLPFIMSLDNLMAGVGLGTVGYPVMSTSIIIGGCAGTMCLIGLLLGQKIRGFIPEKLELISGVYFIGLAVLSILNN